MMSRRSDKPKLTIRSLKDLSLYSSFDVSQWCVKHGIESMYLEYHKERIMEVLWVYHRVPSVLLKDARKPGLVLKKFPQVRGEKIQQTLARAQAYVEATYDIDMKWLPSLNAAFPAPAVDLLTAELHDLISVWGLNTYDVPSLTLSPERVKSIKTTYPKPRVASSKESHG